MKYMETKDYRGIIFFFLRQLVAINALKIVKTGVNF